MIDRYEAQRGHRTTVLTVDQGAATGTLGAMHSDLTGHPLAVELRDPDDVDTPWILLPWTSVVAIHPAEDAHPEADSSTHPAGALTTDAD